MAKNKLSFVEFFLLWAKRQRWDGNALLNANKTIKELTTQLTNANKTISELKQWQNQDRFTIIYPNGGTEEALANVEANNRYILDNPFEGSPVIVMAEIFQNNVWGESGWLWSQYGYGTKASHVLETDEIIVQTGSGYVGHGMSASIGSPHGSVSTALITKAPCRVKVWRV